MPFKILQPTPDKVPAQEMITLEEYFRLLAERDREGIQVLKERAQEREAQRAAAKPKSTRRKPRASKS